MKRRRLPQGVSLEDLDFTPSEGDDCVKCGACCSLLPDTDVAPPTDGGYVELMHGDLVTANYPEKFLIDKQGHSPNTSGKYLKVIPDPKSGAHTCPFRTGYVGEEAPCTIYDRRPRACKIFEKGSYACVKFRKEHYLKGAPIYPRLVGRRCVEFEEYDELEEAKLEAVEVG